MSKPRGRPRAYDPERALNQALDAFWKGGFSGTSLDTLKQATGMNKPSLYAGLGDKQTIYLKAMERFRVYARERYEDALTRRGADEPFARVVERYFDAAIDLYLGNPGGVSGCALISTATAEALNDEAIRSLLDGVLQDMDSQVEVRLRRALAEGALPEGTDIDGLTCLMTAVVHSIGIRARAGQSRARLREMARGLSGLLAPGPGDPE